MSSFTFSTHPFTSISYSDLLSDDPIPSGAGNRNNNLSDRIAERSGSGVPKFTSIPPPSLPISPSSYFSIPPGLSPAELLDSPVLLNTSNILPSPTTGTFPARSFNWKTNSGGDNQPEIKQENRNYSEFSFQSRMKPPTNSLTNFQSSTTQIPSTQQHSWGYQQLQKQDDFSSTKPEYNSIQKSSSEIGSGGMESDYTNSNQQSQSQRKSDDGWNWRKYGQKQVKGSENPRSYYKCTFPNCPTKKKVEKSIDGQITEIVYKGSHSHPKPQSTRKSSTTASSVSSQVSSVRNVEIHDQSFLNQLETVATTPENSSISIGDDEFDRSSQRSKSGGGDEVDDDEPDAKRWRKESENEGISAAGNRTVREPRVVVQTTSDIDILDDGYRWRKYGQKVVKGNPNPRSYYKCTNPGCPVRKHVERASHDLRAVITTYEGKHNHDVPAARGSGGQAMQRLLSENHNNNNAVTTIRPSTVTHNSNNNVNYPIRNLSEGQSPFTLEMLQGSEGFGFSGFGNSMGSYMNQSQENDNVISRTKNEPKDDIFLESFLY